MKNILFILSIFTFFSCSNETLFGEENRNDFYLEHEGATLPIVVEGNTTSKVFLILLHGGPGGSAQEFNAGAKPFSDKLEEKFAMVYYDQRNAGLARGEWDEEKLTIEQHVEDLDQVIEFLYFKYGSDIKLFLAGHSWGTYLGNAYLFDQTRQAKIKAWININGITHRNKRNVHILNRVNSIALNQLGTTDNFDWIDVRSAAVQQLDQNIDQYNAETESSINNLKAQAEILINQDQLLVWNTSSITSSIYNDNYDPMMMLVNDRKGSLVEQMYNFDRIVESSMIEISIPTLCVYGHYDVTTPSMQGSYLLSNIST